MITQLISTLVHSSTIPLPPSSADVIDGSPLTAYYYAGCPTQYHSLSLTLTPREHITKAWHVHNALVMPSRPGTHFHDRLGLEAERGSLRIRKRIRYAVSAIPRMCTRTRTFSSPCFACFPCRFLGIIDLTFFLSIPPIYKPAGNGGNLSSAGVPLSSSRDALSL